MPFSETVQQNLLKNARHPDLLQVFGAGMRWSRSCAEISR